MATLVKSFVLTTVCLTSGRVSAFSSIPSIIFPSPQSLSTHVESSAVLLFGRNSKKGRLGGLVAEDGDAVVTTSPKKTRTKPKKSTKTKEATPPKGSESSGTIAPGLAKWVAQQDGVPETTVAEAKTKKSKKSDRRVKRNIRRDQEEIRNFEIEGAVKRLEKALEENGNLDGILLAVRGLIQVGGDAEIGSATLKTLLSGKKRSDYRLAWVGGDDAICHLGTGLHKVPLARLQEVYFSCLGRNRIEVSEVIRILGPFPNVRNILQGSTKVGGQNKEVESMNIVIDSMVDGTGKEILAGTEENVRRVDLQIFFCAERAIVAVVPPEDGSVRSDPVEDNGAHVLVFVREKELSERLDELRVS